MFLYGTLICDVIHILKCKESYTLLHPCASIKAIEGFFLYRKLQVRRIDKIIINHFCCLLNSYKQNVIAEVGKFGTETPQLKMIYNMLLRNKQGQH